MAKFTGTKGSVYVDDVKLASTTSWSFTKTAEKIDVSEQGTAGKEYIGGAVETTGTFDLRFNSGDSGQEDAMTLVDTGQQCELQLFVEDGDYSVSFTGGSIVLDSYSITTALDSAVDMTMSFAGNLVLSGA